MNSYFESSQEMQKETTSKDYTNFFFRKVDGEDKISVCIHCDKKLSRDNGYSNLMSHLTKQHPDYVKIYEAQNGKSDTSGSTLDKMWQASEDAKKIHFWMKKVVFLPEPFIYVENPVAREVLSSLSLFVLSKFKLDYLYFRE